MKNHQTHLYRVVGCLMSRRTHLSSIKPIYDAKYFWNLPEGELRLFFASHARTHVQCTHTLILWCLHFTNLTKKSLDNHMKIAISGHFASKSVQKCDHTSHAQKRATRTHISHTFQNGFRTHTPHYSI